MLTEEGREAARDCLLRSGMIDPTENLITTKRLPNLDPSNMSDLKLVCANISKGVTLGSTTSSFLKKSIDVPPESLDRFLRMGYSKEKILSAFIEVSETSQNEEISSLWPAVLCHLREEQVYSLPLDSHRTPREDSLALANTSQSSDGQVDLVMVESSQMELDCSSALPGTNSSCLTVHSSFPSRACTSTDYPGYKRGLDGSVRNLNVLSMPPLRFGERFAEAYKVVLVLDDREQFATHGSRKIIENIRTPFKIQVEVRRLPVGDGIWIARDKRLSSEYVLDFIVERKRVDDLRNSIRDNRYRDQKLRLLRCGLKKLIYVVEGDPNKCEAAESIKTACLTTEILEGFDVQRTSGLGDTLNKYGYLTLAIAEYYHLQSLKDIQNSLEVCPPFDDFIRRCQNLEKMTVNDVFAIQLMQVPQVTEEVALAVLDLYPTLLSLARAYTLLEGDVSAQEEMLKKQSNGMINGAASRNIFQLVWGS